MHRRFIKIKTAVPGFHSWPEASGQVLFLKAPHRHMFHYAVTLAVDHDDRDLEFFTLKSGFETWLRTTYPNDAYGFEFGNRSCEMLAAEALDFFHYRVTSVEVWEDNENGALVQREVPHE